MEERTIAAVATPAGSGAIAVIRLSGMQAAEVACRALGGRKLEPRRATLARVRDARGMALDEVVATFFAAPASFTGEDVVEISCHGGPLVTQRVLERLLECGSVPAEPGEFSRRAFENGKMDLTQAESVMDIIQAGSDLALRVAQNQLQGAISRQVEQMIDQLVDVAAHLEAYIDFPEEELPLETTRDWLSRLELVSSELEDLLGTADTGRFLREGVRTAIVGVPNAGKSSLLNRLLGYERAIVSQVAGTTRDTVEETVNLGGLCLRLIDTAGLHESGDELERCGMERSRRAIESADLVLEVVDASQPPARLDLPLEGKHHLLVLNKCDLKKHPAWEGSSGVQVSCRSGEGLNALRDAVHQLFLRDVGEQETWAAINTRHRYALQQARESLARVKEGLEQGMGAELIDVDLREMLDALGSITGKVDTEDILMRVFSTFCLGK